MIIRYGKGTTEFGPGIDIELTGNEVALAIEAWLVGQDVHIRGSRTIHVNEDLIENARIYLDPSATLMARGKGFSGRGPDNED